MENSNMTLREFASHLAICIMESPELGEIPMYLSRDGEGNEFRPYSGDFDVYTGADLDLDVEGKVAVFYPNW